MDILLKDLKSLRHSHEGVGQVQFRDLLNCGQLEFLYQFNWLLKYTIIV